jgi:hypothetical protein
MRKIITLILFCLVTVTAQAQRVELDSSLARYFAPISDTLVVTDRPAATRFYVYVTIDLLYGACTIAWQLAYTEEGTTYTLKTGQVQMAGDAYLAYTLHNRNIVDLFTYAGAAVGVTFIP